MPYTPHVWAPADILTVARMNNLETQFDEAVADLMLDQKPPIAARWVIPGWFTYTAGQNRAVTANRIYYTPIRVSALETYDRIGINVGVGDGAGGLADLRIFEWTAGGVPGDLVLSCGTVSTNAAAAVEIDISATAVGTTGLSRGYYFLAIRCDNTPSIVDVVPAAGQMGIGMPVSGISTANGGAANLVIPYDDAAYADPAGAVDGVLTYGFCFVWLRES